MNVASILSLLSLITFLLLGSLVLSRNSESRLNRVFFMLSLSFAAWALGYVIAHNAETARQYLAGYRISAFGWCICCSILMHFFLLLTGNRILRHFWSYFLTYLPAAFFLVLNFFSLFMLLGIEQSPLGWTEIVNDASPLAWSFIAYSQGFIFAGVGLCVHWGMKSNCVREKRQTTVIVITGLLLSDITEIKRAQEDLRYRAHHDVLTGLPNRYIMNDRLSQSIKQAARHKYLVAVMPRYGTDARHLQYSTDARQCVSTSS